LESMCIKIDVKKKHIPESILWRGKHWGRLLQEDEARKTIELKDPYRNLEYHTVSLAKTLSGG